jgi:8-oxo-dGTP diphosphatase
MDYGEEVRAAAARELLEETGLVVDVGQVIFVATNFHDPAKVTVGIWFEGTVEGGELEAGDDAVDVGWFSLQELPELAFDTDAALIGTMSPN